jgi:hypothetical protein
MVYWHSMIGTWHDICMNVFVNVNMFSTASMSAIFVFPWGWYFKTETLKEWIYK